MTPPSVVTAEAPDRGRMFYLVDEDLDFIPEVKEFLDWKVATGRSPGTVHAYCSRLCWYYRYLHQRNLGVLETQAADLTEFVIWLCNPHRDVGNVAVIHQPSPLAAPTVNLILQAVGSLYRFLVRRDALDESPVKYVDVPRGCWLTERDLLAHTRRGGQTVQRMELRLKEPKRIPKTVSEGDFEVFLSSIGIGPHPSSDSSGFRDRLLCLVLKESGLRVGELLGIRMEDLDFGGCGVHIRFRTDNPNGSRAKAGYGRDRFVHLPGDLLGMIDVYITEVWIEAEPHTDHLWTVLRANARDRQGRLTLGTALTRSAVEQMFRHYSAKSGVHLHTHMLRHTHATDLVSSYLSEGQAVDWKYVQERLGHSSVVTTMETYTHLSDIDLKRAHEQYMERREKARARRRRTDTANHTHHT